jgi:hypothetical protein
MLQHRPCRTSNNVKSRHGCFWKLSVGILLLSCLSVSWSADVELPNNGSRRTLKSTDTASNHNTPESRHLPPVCSSSSMDANTNGECSAPTTTTTSDSHNDASTCRWWWAPSQIRPHVYSLYTGIHLSSGQSLIDPNGDMSDAMFPDPIIPIYDANKNEWSPWHSATIFAAEHYPRQLLHHFYESDLLLTGIANLLQCHDKLANVEYQWQETPAATAQDDMHRSHNPAAGSTVPDGMPWMNVLTTQSLEMGQELLLPCPDYVNKESDDFYYDFGDGTEVEDDNDRDEAVLNEFPEGESIRDLQWLEQHGACLDRLSIQPSKITQPQRSLSETTTSAATSVGRGAFARQSVSKDQVILVTPVLHLDRSQIEIVSQKPEPPTPIHMEEFSILPLQRDHGLYFNNTHVSGHQVWINYCFGHPDSDVLLFPLAPDMTAVNHAPSPDQANAYLRWYNSPWNEDYKSQTTHALLNQPCTNAMALEVVALRDVAAGEEILLDYGAAWQQAWEEHVAKWPYTNETDYISARDFRRQHKEQNEEVIFRTLDEQESEPYPENIQTACYFSGVVDELKELAEDEGILWNEVDLQCLRPCSILERYPPVEDNQDDAWRYTVQVYSMPNFREPYYCYPLSEEGMTVTSVPSKALDWIDVPYSTDIHLPAAFRHEIGVPTHDFYPVQWMRADTQPQGDFVPSPLQPGQMELILWKDTQQPVTAHAYRLGLTRRIRDVLLEYCAHMGILDMFRHVTVEGNGLEPGTDAYMKLNGFNWYLQRPDPYWQSNMHWLSPADNPAHEDYLQALSVAGFDDILAKIGRHLNMDGLVAFHVTFIAVHHSSQGYIHYDVMNTSAKAYNVIIPLILANYTGPELDLRDMDRFDSDGNPVVGRYRYEYEVASMMGDEAFHGTSAVDYRFHKEMRLAATVYIADVNEDNMQSIMNEYTQAYPPQDPDLLLSWAGRHWRKDDPTRHLPYPESNHVLRQHNVATPV